MVLLPTLTHLSDDAIGLILILTCPAILSLVSLSDLKSEIYTFTADWSVSGHGPMTIYKRCQFLSSFWQHRMYTCDWSVTYCKHFLWSYKSDTGENQTFAVS